MRLPSPITLDDADRKDLPPELLSEVMQSFTEAAAALRREVLRIPEFMPPKVWVSSNIHLNLKLSLREGWLEYTGYQSALSDYFMDENCKQLTILKGTRIGWSLFIASLAMYIAGYLNKTVTISQPTEKDAQAFYKEVIEPMIACCYPKDDDGDESKWLKNQRIAGSWDLIQFRGGGCIRLIGATEDDNFRRFDSPFNFMDEYSADAYEPSKGSQGTKKSLFAERGGAHWHTLIGVGSSPLSKEHCRTFAEYQLSDKRLPWVTCPHCDRNQVMEWGDRDSAFGFKWTCSETTGFVEDAWYQCVEGCHITDRDKIALDRSLEYIPSAVPTTPGHYGLHIPQWMSFAGQASYKAICQRWLNSQGDPELLKTFTNNIRAWVWDEYVTSAMEPKAINSILRPYPAEVPEDVVVITAGIDMQDNKEGSVLERVASRELQVVGWNAIGQFRIIGKWVVIGEPGDPASDAELRQLLNRAYHKRDGSKWYIKAVAHDFGNNSGFADEIRRFCNSFEPSRNIWAIKGHSHRKDFVWPQPVGKAKGRSRSKAGHIFYTIDSHNARDAIFKKMQLADDKAPMAPVSLGEDYIVKLMCQERYRKDGRWHWRDKKGHRAEEEWMTLAYAFAALEGLRVNYKKTWGDLNLAASSMGIPSVMHDPVTGEIGYEGEDKSIAGIELKLPGEPPAMTPVESRPQKPSASARRWNPVAAKTAETVASPAPVQVATTPKRKRRSGGIRAMA